MLIVLIFTKFLLTISLSSLRYSLPILLFYIQYFKISKIINNIYCMYTKLNEIKDNWKCICHLPYQYESGRIIQIYIYNNDYDITYDLWHDQIDVLNADFSNLIFIAIKLKSMKTWMVVSSSIFHFKIYQNQINIDLLLAFENF